MTVEIIWMGSGCMTHLTAREECAGVMIKRRLLNSGMACCLVDVIREWAVETRRSNSEGTLRLMSSAL